MSKKDLTKKESNLCTTIRQHFQTQGVFDEIKCQLQHRLVEMMRGCGNDDNNNNKSHTRRLANKQQQDTRTLLVNQLIMEYLHWHQFNYSAQMFAMEAQMDNCNPKRKSLETALGQFDMEDVPILLEIVLKILKEKKEEEAEEIFDST